jgi:hypothetical protein
MSIILNGTTGITTPDVTSDGSLKIDASAPDDSVVVDASGNVGIGTSLPSSLLDVNGAFSLQGTTLPSAGTARIFSRSSDSSMYLQTASSGTMYLLDGSQNTMAGFGSSVVFFATGNTERARIDSDGLKFNGDTAAANALDDYEEGTWTPTSPTAGYTFSSASGTYIKIGKMVYVSCSLTFSAVPASNSSCAFSGMPFTPSNTTAGTFRDNSVTGTIYVFRIATSFEINSMDGVTAGSNRTIRINESYVGFAVYEI